MVYTLYVNKTLEIFNNEDLLTYYLIRSSQMFSMRS